jgi:hypothetical protein
VLFYSLKRLDYPVDKFYEIDIFLILILLYLFAVIVQTIFFIKRIKIRKVHLEKVKSINPGLIEKTFYPERLRFFNVKLSINSKTIDVFDKLSFMLCARKIDKTIEVKSCYKNHIYSFHDIDSILFEFDNIYYFTLRRDWDKTIWLGSFSIVLKSKKIVHLFDLKSERDHLKEFSEYIDMDTDENYYKIGLRILEILTKELTMNYTIIDYTKKPVANK